MADPATGFDWKALPEKALVVDVGGGVGSQTLTLAKKFSHLNFVIQDTDATQPNAEKVCCSVLRACAVSHTYLEVLVGVFP